MNFHAVFEAAEELLRKAKKKCGDTEKNKEKLEASCTGFSAVIWFSVSRNVLFCKENKNSNVDNFLPELDKNSPTIS